MRDLNRFRESCGTTGRQKNSCCRFPVGVGRCVGSAVLRQNRFKRDTVFCFSKNYDLRDENKITVFRAPDKMGNEDNL